MISLPTVSRMSRGGMQVIMESLRKSGVPMAWFHCSGVGRSTTTPLSSQILTRFSRQALPTSTVRSGRRPHMPRMSESTGTFSEVAGSSGGMTELSQRPTMTRFSGSQSFQEFTIFAIVVSFLAGAKLPLPFTTDFPTACRLQLLHGGVQFAESSVCPDSTDPVQALLSALLCLELYPPF